MNGLNAPAHLFGSFLLERFKPRDRLVTLVIMAIFATVQTLIESENEEKQEACPLP